MHKNEPSSSLWSSAAVAVLLVVSGGVVYRVLAAGYARASQSVPIPAGTLAQLPIEIDEWVGIEQELDDRIIEATDTDDHLNRAYRRGGDAVGLFVGYGVDLRDLAPHRPEVCYPGAGWLLAQTREIELDSDGGFKAQVHRFYRGGFTADRITMLNYYIVDGAYCSNVSLLRSRAWQRDERATYAAQVQVVCGGAVDVERASDLVRSFAKASAPLIRDLLVSSVAKSLETKH